MNSKPIKYLLLGISVIVWATIVYKVFAALSNDNTALVPQAKASRFDYRIPTDSFELLANYKDPFIPPEDSAQETDKHNSAASLEAPVSPIVNTPVNQQPGPDLFSSLHFIGTISNPEKKKELAIVEIAGKQYLAGTGDKIQSFKILRIRREKLTVLLNGTKRDIYKKNE